MSYIPEENNLDKTLVSRLFHIPVLQCDPENDKDHFIADFRYIDLLATEIKPIAFVDKVTRGIPIAGRWIN